MPNNFLFQFKRFQFPVNVCFAVTINKSQVQVLRKAGVDLRTEYFSLGQLDIVCSRVSKSSDLFICSDGGTKDVVNKEAFQ